MKRSIALLFALLLVSALILPAAAAGGSGYVFDDADLLNDAEEAELNTLAASIAQRYGCSLYMMTVEDYRDYGEDADIFNVTWGIYHDRGLGWGSERNGILLVLSMRYRDYAFFVYGDQAEYAFDSYGQAQFEDSFLSRFGCDDWYGGFRSYLETGGDYLALAAQGDPVRKDATPMVLFFAGLGCVIALVITLIFRAKMKNVRTGDSARAYIAPGGLNLTLTQDIFTHKTQTRRKIEKSSGGSGGGGRSGGGGSGRSGKF